MRPLAFVLILLAARPVPACTAFLRDGPDGPVLGKSYDWNDERGLVLVNKRDMEKRALVLEPGAAPAAWRSRLASLTFNQYGRELPNGGINEAGLVVEVLLLPETEPEPPDARPTITELGLVQYLLDQAATTAQAIALARAVRIAPASAPIHYLVCDAAGGCAALELLRGRLAVSTGEAMPVRALTNSPYALALRSMPRPPGDPQGSLARFARVAGRLGDAAADGPVEGALSLLESVRFEDSTQWQIVYDLGARRVHFRSRRHPSLKTVSLGAFPPSCAEPVMMLDMASDRAGDVTAELVPYSGEKNRDLTAATLRSRRDALPAGALQRVVSHPGTQVCAAP